ncbi:MAG: tetratricopeptide repeat protein [Rhizobiales bacterium]|nr:tetratricopeptide repeat protein [Hyphomicrobiales bacterium]
MSRRMTRLATLLVALAVLGAAPSRAQEAAAPTPATPAAAATAPTRVVDVDESGLRFYASQNDRVRVDAETRRLKALYPEWIVPDDLFAPQTQGGENEGPLWELFSADKMDELAAMIEARKQAEPGWEPSRDFMGKFRRKQARLKVMALSADKEWKKLAAFAESNAAVGEIGDVDVLWTLAEGFARAKLRAKAVATYASILESSTDSAERIGTMHKAIANLQIADIETLIAKGRKTPEGKNEFDAILVDIARARLSAYLRGERAEEVATADLAAFEAHARQAADPNEAALVAWYRNRRKEYEPALDWFKRAIAQGGDAMVAHGLAHVLRAQGYYREAEDVAFAWRRGEPGNRILFLDVLERDLARDTPPYIEPERLARYGRAVLEDASATGARALAWYAFNTCQYDVALEWFERAVAWRPREDVVYGYAATLRKLKREQPFLEVVNRADGLHPKVVAMLFPEEEYHPPKPCEITSWEQARWWEMFLAQNPWIEQAHEAARGGAKALPGRPEDEKEERSGPGPYSSGSTGFVPNALHDPLGRHSWGVVTGPSGRLYPQMRPPPAPFYPPTFGVAKPPPTPAEFPLPVLPENPMRFAAQSAPAPLAATPAKGVPVAPATAYAREPFAGPYPLLPRRVPGVGAMPYEKFGVQLLDNPEPGQPVGAQPKPSSAPGPHAGVSHEVTSALAAPVLAQAQARTQERRPHPAQRPAPPAAPPAPALVSQLPPVLAAPAGGDLYAPPPPSSLPAAVPLAPSQPSPYANASGAPVRMPAAPAGFPAVAPVMPSLAPPPAARAVPAPAPVAMPPANAPQLPAGYAQTYPQAYPQPYPAQPQPALPGAFAAVPPPAAWTPAAPAQAEPPRPAPERKAHRRPVASGGAASGAGRCSLGAGGDAAGLSGAAAVSNGWCLLNAGRPAEALISFDRAIGAPGKTGEEAAYGKSLAQLQSNDPRGAAATAAQGALPADKRGAIGVMALEQRIFAAYDKGDYVGALSLLRQRAPYAVESRDLTLMRAWSLFQLGKLDDAERLFRTLDEQMSTKESRAGLAAISGKTLRMQY